MFYDEAKIQVFGGDGGNGVAAFRREKYVPKGGPSGGNGGSGGSVILRADEGLRTLVDFKYQKHYRAERGGHGEGQKRHGKHGQDLIIRVPVGTVVRDAQTGELLGDLIEQEQEITAAKGGRGGKGNASFATSRNRAPSFAEKGDKGEERELYLELKLLADVGLIGFPNVGKSTIISRVSAAEPKIDNYHFTTVKPNLGVVSLQAGKSFVAADIPGIIEGAHEGKGLGHKFLRHIERTRLLIHVLDVSESEGRDAVDDFHKVNAELKNHSEKLAGKRQIIAANKIDITGAEKKLDKLYNALSSDYEIFPISAAVGDGLDKLMYRAGEMLEKIEEETSFEEETEEQFVFTPEIDKERFTVIKKDENLFVVKGNAIEKQVARTDLDNEEAVTRLQLIFDRMGIEDALRKKGIKEGDTVQIGEIEFDFFD